MKRIFLPLVAARLVVIGQKTVFHIGNNKFHVEAPRKLMERLVVLCNGRVSIDRVVEELKNDWDEKSLRNLIKGLRGRGVLINGSMANEISWELVEDPIGFPLFLNEEDKNRMVKSAINRQKEGVCGKMYNTSLTSYGKLLKKRHSVRAFSGKASFRSIINILWSAYGEINNGLRRTVPSAGALYPLNFHVVLLQKTGRIIPGIYRVRYGFPESVGIELVSEDIDCFVRSFTNPMILEGVHGVIVISGSFRITAEKYGSRSMLFVVLEAGHAAQNINIAAVEKNIATVEIGGFREKLLAKAIHLPRQYHPLITTAFGREMPAFKGNLPSDKNEVEIQWQMPANDRYCPPFAIASARVSKKRSWSNGRDISPRLAYIKATAEAKEWAACGNISANFIQAAFVDIETAIDPRSIIKFQPMQYRLKGFPFKPFDETAKYGWVEGHDEITGSKVHVLADHVYFPYFPKTPYYCYANSSGVAAHPDKQRAVETSVLELVERDSFMIAYLTRTQFPTVTEHTLPESIRKRIQELRKAGFRVWIKDHSLDLAPAVCIMAQSEEFTYTPCASCARFDIEHAINHALMEVEALILVRLQNGQTEPIKPEKVMWPMDHGRLYGQKRYFHRADFLMHGREKIAFREIGKHASQSWQELLDRFKLKKWKFLTVPLFLSEKYGGNGDLHIVRSIIPGMVPMTFGFRQEPAGMERIYAIAREFGNCNLSYRELTKFPHPFA